MRYACHTTVKTLTLLTLYIDSVFPMLTANISGSSYVTSEAILSTQNEYVDKINMKLIDRFPGKEMVYHSFDCAEDDPYNYYPSEFLNSLTPNGLPLHVLKLRNLDPANGLCNGTRLVVRAFQRNTIYAEIMLGQHAGKRVFVPQILNVGVYLPDSVFSHGQLYIALSLASARSNIRMDGSFNSAGTFTKNIVYKDVHIS